MFYHLDSLAFEAFLSIMGNKTKFSAGPDAHFFQGYKMKTEK